MPIAGAALWTGAGEMPGWIAHHGHCGHGCYSGNLREKVIFKESLEGEWESARYDFQRRGSMYSGLKE